MTMASYQRAVPVLQVANVETSLRWYADVLGFAANPFPKSPPYSFAMLRRDDAEIMLQCADETDGRARRRAGLIRSFAGRFTFGSAEPRSSRWLPQPERRRR